MKVSCVDNSDFWWVEFMNNDWKKTKKGDEEKNKRKKN